MKNIETKINNANQPITHIKTLSHDGRGIATIDGKTTFLEGGLPGEEVRFQIHQKRPTFHEGKVTEILTPSPDRTTPPCAHFGVCGGCSLQHMNPALQLTLKQNTLLDQLKHFGKVIPLNILPPLSHESLGYRHKARLGVKYVIKKEKLLVGFREKSSRYLADLKSCVVLHPVVGLRLDTLAAVVASLTAYQHIAQIEVSKGDTDTALIFRHLTPLTEEDKNKLIQFGEKENFHVYLQPNAPEKLSKIWPMDENHRLSYSLPDHDLTFQFHPQDFTQVNLAMNRLMVNQALTLLNPESHETVLDLFSGIGNFTLPIAKRAKHVVGVEGSLEMVNRGHENAALNNILNVSFYAADLTKESTADWTKNQYDKILLDPPRTGAIELIPLLEKTHAKRIVYISCNPATLARDAGALTSQGKYQLTHAGIMNMFPHTAHIEAIAVFDKT